MQFPGKETCLRAFALIFFFLLLRRQCLFHYLTNFINKVILKPFYPLSPFSICSHIDLKCSLYWIMYMKDSMKLGENIGFRLTHQCSYPDHSTDNYIGS